MIPFMKGKGVAGALMSPSAAALTEEQLSRSERGGSAGSVELNFHALFSSPKMFHFPTHNLI